MSEYMAGVKRLAQRLRDVKKQEGVLAFLDEVVTEGNARSDFLARNALEDLDMELEVDAATGDLRRRTMLLWEQVSYLFPEMSEVDDDYWAGGGYFLFQMVAPESLYLAVCLHGFFGSVDIEIRAPYTLYEVVAALPPSTGRKKLAAMLHTLPDYLEAP